MMAEFSGDGPICPHCKREFTPDEAGWYEDSVVDCDTCEKQFRMEVETATYWRTTPTESEPLDEGSDA